MFNDGSSPRLWGTVKGSRRVEEEMRFIPTPVGNGVANIIIKSINAVHPHACGERHQVLI